MPRHGYRQGLGKHNFEFSGQRLCEIWRCNNIHGRQVYVNYVDYNKDLFHNKGEEPTTWVLPYLSRQGMIESLDDIDNNNRLSNSNFIEDFSNLLSSCTPFQSKENFDLQKVLNKAIIGLK
ncbi:7589_t:CDS:2 [Gigaspora rosea]|nr:7589_t:CDS:2 [Gigaspora rosea]